MQRSRRRRSMDAWIASRNAAGARPPSGGSWPTRRMVTARRRADAMARNPHTATRSAIPVQPGLASHAFAEQNVPRYTSYRTAPFSDEVVGPEPYGACLAAPPEGEPLSLYLHVP